MEDDVITYRELLDAYVQAVKVAKENPLNSDLIIEVKRLHGKLIRMEAAVPFRSSMVGNYIPNSYNNG